MTLKDVNFEQELIQIKAIKKSGGWMGRWVDVWIVGWMGGRKSHFKDCLQHIWIKVINERFLVKIKLGCF